MRGFGPSIFGVVMEIKLGTDKLLDDACVSRRSKEKKRDYIGASMLGEDCERQLWYNIKTPKPIDDPRVLRIFDMGDMVEEYLVQLLKDAGITVWDVDENGDQFGFVDGRVAGHCDGVAQGFPESTVPHLLEFKSANNKNFKAFVKKGVKAQSMKYWVQVQIYMEKLNLTRCMFMVYNKDTSELYTERIKYERSAGTMYIDRAKEIDEQDTPPDRKYKSKDFFKCRFCNHREECWDGE
jgi:hypothetical protein